MRMLLVALIVTVTLGLFGTSALQAAGDVWPGGGAVPPVLHIAGDVWPGGG